MRRALILLAAAAVAVAGGGVAIAATWHLGFWRGLYCSLGTAATVGCDSEPPGTAGRLVAVAVILTAVPLVAASFGLATSAHVGKRVRSHLDKRLAEHHEAIHGRLDRLEQARQPRRRGT